MARILIIDDEPLILRSIRRVLEREGFEVSEASGGHQGLELVTQESPDLVVLDIVMPEMSGQEVCRRLRADPFTARLPIIFLTAQGRSEQIAQGLDAGADDYLVKPFDVIELPARIRALLRRAPSGPLDANSDHLVVGDLRLHSTHPEVQVKGAAIILTSVEHRLLHYLMLHAGKPISIDQLLQDIWEYPPGVGNPKLVQTHVANLRIKIEPQPDTPQYVLNIRGRGYIVENAPRTLPTTLADI
jgi:DNA-binding response OmpR family regulator